MASPHLDKAKSAKNDEFYTQYHDIEKEVNAYIEYNPDAFKDKIILLPCDDPEWSNFTKYFAQNFEKLKLKKLISTSYAIKSKKYKKGYQTTLFEKGNPNFDKKKTRIKGKFFILARDKTGDGRIDIDDLDWQYMEGDGDFRSKEVKKLREEADIIITNPPFSLFREFLAWIIEAKKEFMIIGNMNAITYKDVFPWIKDNNVWLGMSSGAKTYIKPDGTEQKMGNTCWFTNLEHGRRHQPLPLMSMKDNLKFNQKIKDKKNYDKYKNYDAIEVPFADAIPSDYKGTMGVPISFLEKYNPKQFEIIGSNLTHGIPMSKVAKKGTFVQGGPSFYTDNGDGTFKRIYTRILIKHKN